MIAGKDVPMYKNVMKRIVLVIWAMRRARRMSACVIEVVEAR